MAKLPNSTTVTTNHNPIRIKIETFSTDNFRTSNTTRNPSTPGTATLQPNTVEKLQITHIPAPTSLPEDKEEEEDDAGEELRSKTEDTSFPAPLAM